MDVHFTRMASCEPFSISTERATGNVKEVFILAADHIEKYGLSKGCIANEDLAVCLWGGIFLYSENREVASRAVGFLHNKLFPRSVVHLATIFKVSDKEDFTKEKAVTLLRQTAESIGE